MPVSGECIGIVCATGIGVGIGAAVTGVTVAGIISTPWWRPDSPRSLLFSLMHYLILFIKEYRGIRVWSGCLR
jgi:hypothetical protein